MGMSTLGAAAAIMAGIKEGLGSEAPIPPSCTSGLSPPPRQAGIWVEYGVDGKGVGGYIFTVCQKGFQGSLVMIGVSIRQFSHVECWVV